MGSNCRHRAPALSQTTKGKTENQKFFPGHQGRPQPDSPDDGKGRLCATKALGREQTVCSCAPGSRPWRSEAEAHKTEAAALGNQKSGCRGSQPCCCTGRIPSTSGILEAKAQGFGGAVPPKKEVVTGKRVHLHRPRLWLECMMNSRDLMVIFMEI